MFDKDLFADRIKYFRQHYKLTLNDIAEKSDVDAVTVSRWESRVYVPSTRNAIAILNALNIDFYTCLNENDKSFDSHLTKQILQKLKKLSAKDRKIAKYILYY